MIDVAGGNKAYFYHFDRTGSTLALTDGTGSVSDAYAYDPYGRLLGRTGSSVQPFTFVGQWGVRQEGSSGTLYHMRARYYDAAAGRFLSRDPVWPQLADPSQLNPYQYAGQDPIGTVDPSGSGTLVGIGYRVYPLELPAPQTPWKVPPQFEGLQYYGEEGVWYDPKADRLYCGWGVAGAVADIFFDPCSEETDQRLRQKYGLPPKGQQKPKPTPPDTGRRETPDKVRERVQNASGKEAMAPPPGQLPPHIRYDPSTGTYYRREVQVRGGTLLGFGGTNWREGGTMVEMWVPTDPGEIQPSQPPTPPVYVPLPGF